MQVAIDQRSRDGARVPIDLFIRLAHEDYEDAFDADGVDLSIGGIALRSDYLPEVGDRLQMRFDNPASGEEIEVDGEVVWAHDAGERSGEFGLRFETVDGEVAASLRALVSHLGGDAKTVARLHLDGVASPIEAEILDRDARWLTVEQELPFLELGMGVTIENGGGAPRGRLASVDLRIENGTPRLVLSVELDSLEEETFDPYAEDDAEDEVAYASPNDVATLDEPEEPVADATMQDYDLPDELREAVEAAPPVERDEVKVFAIEDDEDDEDELYDEDSFEENLEPTRDAITPGDLTAAPDDPVGGLQAKLAPIVAALRKGLNQGWIKTKPMLVAFWAKLLAFLATVAKKGGPKAKALLAKLPGVVAKLKPKGKRRTTAAPPKKRRTAGAPRRRQHAEEPAPKKKSGRRILVLSALAFAGVGAAVYALAGGEEEPEVEIPAADSAPVEVEEQTSPTPASAPAPAPALPEEAPAAADAPAEPAAAPEPEGGPLAEPSYPSLRDGTASGPVSEGQSFGSSSAPDDARSATIRMSQPVSTLRGQRQDDGFSVTVPGALALDRAGPIAAANPSVERAMILNRGDHAVLTVRFVAGRNPEYRVVARNRAIVVEIGR